MGGFGDVEQAKLRVSLFGKDPVVALKKLRPAGDRHQRIRVMAVRTTCVCISIRRLKFTPSKSLARELLVWSRLKHENILALEGFYFDESSLKTAWIATLWQENGNVMKFLATNKPGWRTRMGLASQNAYTLRKRC